MPSLIELGWHGIATLAVYAWGAARAIGLFLVGGLGFNLIATYAFAAPGGGNSAATIFLDTSMVGLAVVRRRTGPALAAAAVAAAVVAAAVVAAAVVAAAVVAAAVVAAAVVAAAVVAAAVVAVAVVAAAVVAVAVVAVAVVAVAVVAVAVVAVAVVAVAVVVVAAGVALIAVNDAHGIPILGGLAIGAGLALAGGPRGQRHATGPAA